MTENADTSVRCRFADAPGAACVIERKAIAPAAIKRCIFGIAAILCLSACGHALRSPSPPGAALTAAPAVTAVSNADDGVLRASSAGVTVALRASDCRAFSSKVDECSGELAIAIDDDAQRPIRQTLPLAKVFVDRDRLLYRGALRERDRPAGYTLILADVDGDRRDDMIVWSGRRGGYGGASYDIHVFDAERGAFRPSREFSDITIGKSAIFWIDDGRIRASSKSGCCIHSEETFAIVAGMPQLIERVTEESASDGGAPKRTVERRVGDTLERVDPKRADQHP